MTGFDGGFVQQMTEPILTSVRIPVDRITAELIGRCLREIDHGPTNEPGLVVTELSVGSSAWPARRSARAGAARPGRSAGGPRPAARHSPGQPQLDPVVAVVGAGLSPSPRPSPGPGRGDPGSGASRRTCWSSQ